MGDNVTMVRCYEVTIDDDANGTNCKVVDIEEQLQRNRREHSRKQRKKIADIDPRLYKEHQQQQQQQKQRQSNAMKVGLDVGRRRR